MIKIDLLVPYLTIPSSRLVVSIVIKWYLAFDLAVIQLLSEDLAMTP